MFKRRRSEQDKKARVVFRDFRYFHEGADWEIYIKNKTLSGPGIFEIRAPSGSGKSMVLGFVSGVDQSEYGGSLTVMGTEWRTLARRIGQDRGLGRHRRNIALIPAEATLVGTRTVQETLERDLEGARVKKQDREARITKVLTLLKIPDKANQQLSTLSAGENQRVRIAVALARNASLIVADEPIAHLDATLSQVVLDAFVEQSKHALVLIVHHLTPGAPDLLASHRKELVLLGEYRRDRVAKPLVFEKSHKNLRANAFLMTVMMVLVLSASLFIWRQTQLGSDTQSAGLASPTAPAVAAADVTQPSASGGITVAAPTATIPSDSTLLVASAETPTLETATETSDPSMTPIVFMPGETPESVSVGESSESMSPAIEPIGPEHGVSNGTTPDDAIPQTETAPPTDTDAVGLYEAPVDTEPGVQTDAGVVAASDAPTIDLLSVLPSQSDIPDGLVPRERRTRTLDEVVSNYSNPSLASEQFTAWGWKGNAIASFGLPDGSSAQSGTLNGVYVSIAEFDSPQNAQAALDFMLTEQQASQPLDEVDVGQFGDYTRGLYGLLDYGYETTILTQQGNLVIRVSAAELDTDPTVKTKAIMANVLERYGASSRTGTVGSSTMIPSNIGPSPLVYGERKTVA